MKVTTDVEVHTIKEYQSKFEQLFLEAERNLDCKISDISLHAAMEYADGNNYATAYPENKKRVIVCRMTIESR